MMTRSCVRDLEARKQTSVYVLEKSEPVIKCNAIMIEGFGADPMIERLGADRIIERLGADPMIERFRADSTIERYRDDSIIERFCVDPMMERLDASCSIKEGFVGEDRVIGFDPRTTMEAILSRDQRTTVHRVFDRSLKADTVLSLTTSGVKSSTADSTRCRPEIHRVNVHPVPNTRTWKNDLRMYSQVPSADPCLVTRSRYNHRISSPRFTNTVFPLLRLASLLFAFLIISVNGAPMSLGDKRMDVPPKWLIPCGEAGQASVDYEGDQDVEQISDKQLVVQISMQARTALMHAELFLDAYVKQTFNNDLQILQSEWKKNHYNWLPTLEEIPKHFKENLDPKYLDDLDVRLLDNILLDAYEYMQKFAVGLEQIVWDQEYYNGKFKEQFKQSELNLGAVLCMLQTALIERAVTLRPDVGREVMGPEFRNMKAETYRNLRDWLIFRDYLNGLEFIQQVFEHLEKKLTS